MTGARRGRTVSLSQLIQRGFIMLVKVKAQAKRYACQQLASKSDLSSNAYQLERLRRPRSKRDAES